MRGVCLALCVAAMLAACSADMYLHNMRGSNNRLDEANRDRDNANRLFDSQNNNRGGYNVGKLYFYEGEIVPFEWTNQHGCGNDFNSCEIVVQMMCADNVRDGATTTTIPEQPTNCANNDCNYDVRFGMHEDYDYYTNCKYRFRNRGLFTADRNLNGNTARFTRQNENGNRRGYECPEERDHYPYWHPAPWFDLAVFTNDPARCDYYRNNSENLVGRNYCWLPDSYYHNMVSRGGNGNNGFIPNTEATCLAMNNRNSDMVKFLQQQINADFSVLQTSVNNELLQCNELTAAALDDCERKTTQTAVDACIAAFNATKTVSQATLVAQCPQCPANSLYPEPHPGSVCPVCLKSGCTAKYLAVNASIVTNGGCPSGYSVDPFMTNFCAPTDCLKTNSFDDMKAVDACRTNYLKSSGRLLVNQTDLSCIARPTLTQDCYNTQLKKAAWATADPHNVKYPWLAAPVCAQNLWSRPNHLGNGVNGFQNGFNISMVPVNQQNCVIRARYNITTSDYNGLNPYNSGEVNSTLNRPNGDNAAKINVAQYHDIPTTDSANPWRNARGYLFKNNPQVQIFDFTQVVRYCTAGFTLVANDTTRCRDDTRGTLKAAETTFCPMSNPYLVVDPATNKTALPPRCGASPNATTSVQTATELDFTLQLAINTAQLGRTFEDRSHTFDVQVRNDTVSQSCNRMYALNVRGKRGNIVQTYPGTEYDFVPNRLHVAEGDCIHFQWTGSNTNPNNNDGQGKEGTDRSNIALLESVRGQGGRGVNNFGGYGARGTTWTTKGMEPGMEAWSYMSSPTMADIQCNTALHPNPHPFNWKLCTRSLFNNVTGARQCQWVARPFTNTSNTDGTRKITYLDCSNTTLYTPDTVDAKYCVLKTCLAGGYVARPVNPTKWGPLDTLNGAIWGAPDALKRGGFGVNHPEHLDNVTRIGFLGMTYDQLVDLAILDTVQLGGEMSELDDAGTYFDMAPHQVSSIGTYYYMCTRNNNFSNRGQKGKIVVSAAPEHNAAIGSNGGATGISAAETFQGVPSTTKQVIDSSDFAINVPPKSLPTGANVQMKVLTNDGTTSGSDILWVGPTSLSGVKQFSSTQVTPAAPQRKRAAAAIGDQFWVDVVIVSSTSLSFRIHGSSVSALAKPLATISVIFQDSNGKSVYNVAQPFNGNREIADTWVTTTENLKLLEEGKLSLVLVVNGETLSTPLTPIPGTGAPLVIKMPVSLSLTQGTVYFWPDTPSARACVTDSSNSGCNYLRTAIDGAEFKNGYVSFSVGASVTTPAGGFYKVDAGSDVGVIVGATAACVCLTLAVILCAIYFRKRPEQWAAFKNWGPSKVKSIKRSLASHV